MVQGSQSSVDFTANIQQGQMSANLTPNPASDYSDIFNGIRNLTNTVTTTDKQTQPDYSADYRNELLNIDNYVQDGQMNIEQARIAVKDLDRKYSSIVKGSDMRGIKGEYGYDTVLDYQFEGRAKIEADKTNAEYQAWLNTGESMGLSIANDGVEAVAEAGRRMTNAWKDSSAALSAIKNMESESGRKAIITTAAQEAGFGMIQEVLKKFQTTGKFAPSDKQALYENIAEVARALPVAADMNDREFRVFVKGVTDYATLGLESESDYLQSDTQYYDNVLKNMAKKEFYDSITELGKNNPSAQSTILTTIGAGASPDVISTTLFGSKPGFAAVEAFLGATFNRNTTKDRIPFTPEMRATLNSIVPSPSAPGYYRLTASKRMLDNTNSVLGTDPQSIAQAAASITKEEVTKLRNNAIKDYGVLISGMLQETDPNTRNGIKGVANVMMQNALSTNIADYAPEGIRVIKTPKGYQVEGGGRSAQDIMKGLITGDDNLLNYAGKTDVHNLKYFGETDLFLTRIGTFEEEVNNLNSRIQQIQAASKGQFNNEEIYTNADNALIASGITVIDTNGHVIAGTEQSPTTTSVQTVADPLVNYIRRFESGDSDVGFSTPTYSNIDNSTLLIGHGSRINTADEFAKKLAPVTGLSEQELKNIHKNPELLSTFSITQEQADQLLQNEVQKHTQQAQKFAGKNWDELPQSVQVALIDTSFESGLNPKEFPKLKAALSEEFPSPTKILAETILLRGTSKTRQEEKLNLAVREGIIKEGTPAYRAISNKIKEVSNKSTRTA